MAALARASRSFPPCSYANGIRFNVVTGYLHGDAVVDGQLKKWLLAAGVRRKMRSSSIGLLGRQYPGMMDLYVDENTVMQQFGMMTYFLMWEDVISYAQQVSAEEKDANLQKLRDVFTIPPSVLQAELDTVGYMYGGYMRLVREHNLAVISNHFEKETVGKEVDLMAALNPAHTLMIREGIACTVEGDIKGAIAMLILKAVAGSANLTELYTMDFRDDVAILGHSGASDPCISDLKPVLKTTSVFHGKSGKGFTTQAVPRGGELTMLALTVRDDGKFKMVAAEGMVEEGEILNLGDTNCRVRFAIPMREFVNRWCLEGPSHHGVMGSGNAVENPGKQWRKSSISNWKSSRSIRKHGKRKKDTIDAPQGAYSGRRRIAGQADETHQHVPDDAKGRLSQ